MDKMACQYKNSINYYKIGSYDIILLDLTFARRVKKSVISDNMMVYKVSETAEKNRSGPRGPNYPPAA